jgi:hypothetical protein
MKKVFTFTLFGSDDKYCKGLVKNVEIIQKDFPDFETWVYIGENVPDVVLQKLASFANVRTIHTGETGMVNKLYRFFAIDDPDVEVMIVRDADSRVYQRDRSTIQDFLASGRLVHIVRDHPNHFHKIMAGCFAMRKGLLNATIRTVFDSYRKDHDVNSFWSDQQFLETMFYPYIGGVVLVHDDLQSFEPDIVKTNFKVPIGNGLHFVGQVYEFDKDGNEYPKFRDYFEGGVHGKSFWTAQKLERLGIKHLPAPTNKIHLFTQIYRNTYTESDSEEQKQKVLTRIRELELCFLTNLSHDFVHRMYVFYEKDEDIEHFRNLGKAYETKIVSIKCQRQAHYKDYLLYIRQNILDNELCCIMATDIHFNKDVELSFLERFLPVNTVFGLTRHEPTDEEHTICNETTCVLAHSAGGCADCFMFRTPVPSKFNYEQVDHKQNRWGGECNFLDAWHRVGGKVWNPCLQVKTIHRHKDSVYFTQHPVKVVVGRPYLPYIEPAPKDSNHLINRPTMLFEPNTVFCFRCKAHPNVFCKWLKGGRDWICNICEMHNEYEYRDVSRQRAFHGFSQEVQQVPF